MLVTVAIPVRNGGDRLEEVLTAVRAQRLAPDDALELLVCDSGSSDGSVEVALASGAEVIVIDPDSFSHGGTRNLLMARAQGEVVAMLTQDAVPADDGWLTNLLAGFAVADDVALVFGPYVPRPDASPMVRRELTQWFASLSRDGMARVDRLPPDERDTPARALFGPRGYFTDANACVSRKAWEDVPFRPVPYAEDHLLAHDMMRRGFAKVFAPKARVVHSHDYSAWEWVRRSFDEARAVQDVYDLPGLGDLRRLAMSTWGAVGSDWRSSRATERTGLRSDRSLLARSLQHHTARAVGTALGARADRLPARLVRHLSLERRA